MSTLRVNKITNSAGNGAVEFTKGVSVGPDQTISGNISLSGVCTAASFKGDGSGLTVTGGVTNSKIFAINLIT